MAMVRCLVASVVDHLHFQRSISLKSVGQKFHVKHYQAGGKAASSFGLIGLEMVSMATYSSHRL